MAVVCYSGCRDSCAILGVCSQDPPHSPPTIWPDRSHLLTLPVPLPTLFPTPPRSVLAPSRATCQSTPGILSPLLSRPQRPSTVAPLTSPWCGHLPSGSLLSPPSPGVPVSDVPHQPVCRSALIPCRRAAPSLPCCTHLPELRRLGGCLPALFLCPVPCAMFMPPCRGQRERHRPVSTHLPSTELSEPRSQVAPQAPSKRLCWRSG